MKIEHHQSGSKRVDLCPPWSGPVPIATWQIRRSEQLLQALEQRWQAIQ